MTIMKAQDNTAFYAGLISHKPRFRAVLEVSIIRHRIFYSLKKINKV